MNLKKTGIKADYVKVPMNLEIAFDESGLDLDLENQAELEAKGVRYERDNQIVQVVAGQWYLAKNRSKPLVHLDTKTADLDLYFEVNGRDVGVSGNVVDMGPASEVQMPVEIRGNKTEFIAQCT